MEDREMENRDTEDREVQSWLDILAGVLFSPRSTFQRLAQEPPLGLGIAVFVVVTTVNNLVRSRILAESLVHDLAMFDLNLGAGALVGPYTVFLVIMNLLAGLVLVGLVHLVAGLLGGSGTGRPMAALAGLASLPSAFSAPLLLLDRLGVPGLWAPSLGIGLWQLYLLYRATRAVHALPRRSAVAALMTPFVILAAVFFALLILFGAVVLKGFEDLGSMPWL